MRDQALGVPPGHWREAELLAARGFPPRKSGEPYVVVVHKRGSGAFVLGGVYQILTDHLDDAHETVRLARLHHVSQWDGWLPDAQGRPWWSKQAKQEDFVAYWVAE